MPGLDPTVYAEAVAQDPSLRRGLVCCQVCGRETYVDAALCLRTGWPKHCGATVSVVPISEKPKMVPPLPPPCEPEPCLVGISYERAALDVLLIDLAKFMGEQSGSDRFTVKIYREVR